MSSPEYLGMGSDGGTILGRSTTDKVSLYGVTPISQRSGAAQATSTVGTASSTALDTNTKAMILEIANTLTALGIWKGSA